MKSGQSRIWGRQFSFTVGALVFTTVFFWYWENNPLLIGLLSSQDQFLMHTPDFFSDDSTDSALLFHHSKQLIDEDSHSEMAEDNKYEKTSLHSDSLYNANKPPSGRKYKNGILDSSHNKQELPENACTRFSHLHHVNRKPELCQACNYAKGRWIADGRRPLYSGYGCKQWLSDMWACRLTQHTDFSYEGYRWQPNNCEMPEFQGAEFLKRMQDKAIAFIGDSLGRQQFQSLMCMATGGQERPEVEDVGWRYGLVKPKGAVRPDGWAYWFPNTNTTILYYWSASLCGIEPINATDPATDFAMHLDRPPGFLSHFLPQFDVVILNTGHHWNRGKLRANRWVMYADGKPVTDRKLSQMGNAKNYTVYSISRWLDSHISSRPQLKAFFRTMSPRHFLNGDWNTGGSCDNVIPLTNGDEVRQDESKDPVIANAVRGTKVKILDITAISELRDEAHISRYSIKASDGINDCLHWCLPGIPDTWNELLYAQL